MCQMPCNTITKPAFEPRYPTIKKDGANHAVIPTLTSADFDIGCRSRPKGSPTKVKKTFTPKLKKSGVKIQEESNEASALKLIELLSDASII